MPTLDETVSPIENTNTAVDVFVSVEMSRSKWIIGLHTPLAERISIHSLPAAMPMPFCADRPDAFKG